jgi:hypothetical protein
MMGVIVVAVRVVAMGRRMIVNGCAHKVSVPRSVPNRRSRSA